MIFQILDQTGHSTITFDKTNKIDLEAAEQQFNELIGRGLKPAKSLGGGAHELISKFDPTAEATLFFPQLKGG